jgi:molecular chaperone Hsp33
MTGKPSLSDAVVPFQIETGTARGRFLRLGSSLRAALAGNQYPPPVAEVLGEGLALAVALASGLKYDGTFSLQIKSDGPVNLLVADLTSKGDMRGYARFDPEAVAAAADKAGAPVPRLLGSGFLAFTVDQGPDTERYQGITELSGATLAECAHTYFRHSEQLETAVVIKARGGADPVAAALMLQRMPVPALDAELQEDIWRRLVALTATISVRELLDTGLAPNEVLYRLYNEDGVRVFRSKAVRFRCRCSHKRVAAMLKSFSLEQVEDLKVEGEVRVRCEFCGASYIFDDAALAALHAAGGIKRSRRSPWSDR